MPTVDVSPESLRDAGEKLVNIRSDDLVGNSDTTVAMLHGPNQDGASGRQISVGGFPLGYECQQNLSNLYQQAQGAFMRMRTDLFGLASALYILAEVYGKADNDAAETLRYAFLEDGANRPAGLPDYVDPENNSQIVLEEQQAADALNGGPLPPRWTEETTYPSPWTTVTTIRDENGKVVAVRTQTKDHLNRDVTTTTERFHDGEAVGADVRTDHADGTWETVTKDGDGEVITTTEHTITANGGSRTTTYDGEGGPMREVVHAVVPEYDGDVETGDYASIHYTNEYDEDGNVTREDQGRVSYQPTPPAEGTITAMTEEQQQLQNDQRGRVESGWYSDGDSPNDNAMKQAAEYGELYTEREDGSHDRMIPDTWYEGRDMNDDSPR